MVNEIRKIRLSVVIPTKNRAGLLQKALESIEKQPAAPEVYEVIVIDNGSTDETRDVAESFRGKFRNFRYIYDERPGLHVGRNRGIRESRGELIGYLDDDVILFPNWINTVLEAFEDEEVVHVGGSVIPYEMALITQDFCNKYEIRKGSFRYIYPISCFWEDGITEHDMRVHKTPDGSFFGGNSIYRKNVLLACRGFHPDGMPNNLLMYRGDGETYVAEYIKENKMKAMYYAQASVYHMIDIQRVCDSYIQYMYFRSGISGMYTKLRTGSLIDIMDWFWGIFPRSLRDKENRSYMKGAVYLLLYYIFYKRVRQWVHKKEYF